MTAADNPRAKLSKKAFFMISLMVEASSFRPMASATTRVTDILMPEVAKVVAKI